MTWASRIRLTIGLVAVMVLGAYLTYHLNESRGVAASSTATIGAESYDVGSQYAGLVVDQLVEEGDVVVEGTPLFVIDSSVLRHEVSIGFTPPNTAASSLDPEGRIVILATGPGTVRTVDATRGTFVAAAARLAQVEKAGSLFVEAQYTLSAKEYARIDDNARVTIVLPNQQEFSGHVTDISVETIASKAQAVVTIKSDKLIPGDANGLVTAGTPVTAELRLRNDGVVTDVAASVKRYLDGIGE